MFSVADIGTGTPPQPSSVVGGTNHARHERPMRRAAIFLAQGAIIYRALAGLP